MQVLFTEYTGSPGKMPEKARAIMEAAVSTAISHPNIVSGVLKDVLKQQALLSAA